MNYGNLGGGISRVLFSLCILRLIGIEMHARWLSSGVVVVKGGYAFNTWKDDEQGSATSNPQLTSPTSSASKYPCSSSCHSGDRSVWYRHNFTKDCPNTEPSAVKVPYAPRFDHNPYKCHSTLRCLFKYIIQVFLVINIKISFIAQMNYN